MGDDSAAGISRRDLIKKSVVVGGLVWVAPTVVASPAGAGGNQPCGHCPAGTVFGIKHDVGTPGCTTPGANPNGGGNCSAIAGVTTFRPGCCLETAGLVTFTIVSAGVHRYHLAPGVTMCSASAKCAGTCFTTAPQVVVVDNPDGSTDVTVSCSNLSHSELIVCVRGTSIPTACP